MIENDEIHAGGKEIICRTELGAAILCSCCGCVEITLGNALFSLSREDLDSMLEVLRSFSSGGKHGGSPGSRCYMIRTANNDAAFVFNAREVRELRKLTSAGRRYATTATKGLFGPARARVTH